MIERPALLPCNANLGIDSTGAADCDPSFTERAIGADENAARTDEGWLTRILGRMMESNAQVHLVVPASFAEAIPRRIDGGETAAANSVCPDTMLRM